MAVALVTGSAGLVGSEAVSYFCEKGFRVVGLDNNMRELFFGRDGSTTWNRDRLSEKFKDRYSHYEVDIRDRAAVAEIFGKYSTDITVIIHAAAQPSHDWAISDPYTDFSVNASGTMVLLENTRRYCADAAFIFCSTNKVYGDGPNSLPLVEYDHRWDLPPDHPCYTGLDETLSIDQCLHSLFGASKLAADVLVQEYGRYFGMNTAVFRGGCLTGPRHSGAKLHGFLSYLMRCAVTGTPYRVLGYKGKQVRDNIHSSDLVKAFFEFQASPRSGEVYNIGGGRINSCSILEAIDLCEEITGRRLECHYEEDNRVGDHIWWITSVRKFTCHYPKWELTYGLRDILSEIHDANAGRWSRHHDS